MRRLGAQAFVSYANTVIAGIERVDRVRQALDQSGPMAKRLVMQQLSGINLSTVWDILLAACTDIALYYGVAVVTGAVAGGALGALAFGVGAAPGVMVGAAAGSQVGMWVLTLLGLKELAAGLTDMFPAALRHYERGFREAWGSAPGERPDTWNSATAVSGNASACAWHMAQGHVLMVMTILTALVAYLSRGQAKNALLLQDIQGKRLGKEFADWVVENQKRLLAHPKLQTRPNNSAAMAMSELSPPSRASALHSPPVRQVDAIVASGVDGSRPAFKMNEEGPTKIVARDPVDLAAQSRLNGLDLDRKAFAPGEAGAAAEIEHYLGSTLQRAPGGISADYVVESGNFAGARIDFKLTPDTFAKADKINKYFDRTFPKFSQSVADKLADPMGVDMMPFDTRFLSPENRAKLFDFVNTLPANSQKKVIYLGN